MELVDRTPGKRCFLLAVVIFLFAGMLYAGTLTHGFFLFDDEKQILHNEFIRTTANIPFFFTPVYWTQYQPIRLAGKYRPVRSVSFTLDHALWGKNPLGYHLTNLLLHAVNSVLVFGFALFLLKKDDGSGKQSTSNSRAFGAEGVAVLAALLFAAHPIHTESIIWVKNRSDLLALGFMLPALWMFVRFATEKAFQKSSAFLVLGIVFFIMGLCSKEMAITLPILIALYILIFTEPRKRFRAAWGSAVFFLVAAGFAFFLFYVIKLPPQQNHSNGIGLMDAAMKLAIYPHMLLIVATAFKYAGLLLFPWNLNVEHEMPIPASLFEPEALGGAVVIVFMSMLAVVLRRKKTALFSLIWVAITILPVSNLIYLDSRPLAEQRMYIPSVGFCLLLASGMAWAVRRMEARFPSGIAGFARALLFFILVGGYSFRTVARIDEWNRPLDFWRKTVQVSPSSLFAWVGLANAYGKSGDLTAQENILRKAIRQKPDYVYAYYELGNLYFKRKDIDQAVAAYQDSIRQDPFRSDSYKRLADLHIQAGDYREAILLLQKAVAICSPDVDLYFIAGHAYVKLRRYRQAERYFREALRINPRHALSYNYLGAALIATGEYRQAIDALKRAVRYQPDMGEAHNNLAFAYIEIGDRESAHVHLREAKRLGWKPNRKLERRILE